MARLKAGHSNVAQGPIGCICVESWLGPFLVIMEVTNSALQVKEIPGMHSQSSVLACVENTCHSVILYRTMSQQGTAVEASSFHLSRPT